MARTLNGFSKLKPYGLAWLLELSALHSSCCLVCRGRWRFFGLLVSQRKVCVSLLSVKNQLMNEACCPLVNIMSCPGFCINPANGIARSLQCHGKLTHVPFFAMVDVFADCSLDVAKRWMVLAVFCIAKQGEHSQVKNPQRQRRASSACISH